MFDLDRYSEPLERVAADATFGMEFANPWHDESGRFAPKGVGTRSSGGNEDDVAPVPAPEPEPVAAETVQRRDDGSIIVSDEARQFAAGIRSLAETNEPEITRMIADAVGDAAPESYDADLLEGGELYGYEFRLKDENKIAEKIERNMEEKGLSRADAAKSIKDAVRYTVHFPDDAFGDVAQPFVDKLRADNASVAVKNTWPPEKGSAYKGINLSVTREDGLRFEVQLHTPTSQAVKDKMHLLYEQQRVLPSGSPEWNRLDQEMVAMSEELPMPTGATEVFTIR